MRRRPVAKSMAFVARYSRSITIFMRHVRRRRRLSFVFGILTDSKRYKFARLAAGNQFELEPISLAGKGKIKRIK